MQLGMGVTDEDRRNRFDAAAISEVIMNPATLPGRPRAGIGHEMPGG
jgi:hypothetical protein